MHVRRSQLNRRNYEVDLNISGHIWNFKLQGGLFGNEKKAERAARDMAETACNCLVTAAMIREAMKPHDEVMSFEANEDLRKKRVSNHRQWLRAIGALEELALAVPETRLGFKTGSRAMSEYDYHRVERCMRSYHGYLLNQCPTGSFGGDVKAFMLEWNKRMTQSVRPTEWMMPLFELHNRMNRSGNQPALSGRTEDAADRLRDAVLKRVTAHIPGFLPVIKTAPAIRGDRAKSLMNMMVPRIESQLSLITDATEREALRERLGRLADRVDVASANQNSKRVQQDVRLSIETLEESVESRLTAMEAGPAL